MKVRYFTTMAVHENNRSLGHANKFRSTTKTRPFYNRCILSKVQMCDAFEDIQNITTLSFGDAVYCFFKDTNGVACSCYVTSSRCFVGCDIISYVSRNLYLFLSTKDEISVS